MTNASISLLIGLVFATGCAHTEHGRCCERGDSQVGHVIVCWLKSPGDTEARQKLIDTSQTFPDKISGIVCVRAGTVVPSTRIGVDSTFDVAVVMMFADEAALRAYDSDPTHKQAVEEVLKPLVARFVVYDFVER